MSSSGKTVAKEDGGAEVCIKPNINVNATPDHMKKYRKSYKEQPGATITHYGKVDDRLPEEKFAYGKKTQSSDHVNDLFNHKNGSIKELINNVKEKPLGKTLQRNYVFPNEATQEGFKFGVPTKFSEATAKEVIFPNQQQINEDPKTRQLYLKSHGNYEAGEQRNRNYNWPVDPKQHAFGKSEKIIPEETKIVLHPDFAENQFPKTDVIKKNLEDFRDFNSDHLGKPKNIGQRVSNLPEDYAFGSKPRKNDEWNVAKCIKGEATLQEVTRNEDLGKTTQYGFRNQTKAGDENRVFGVPSIRRDIPKKEFKSIADPNNYGDEKPAVKLLYPQKFASLGLDEKEFKQIRQKEEIRDLFRSIGLDYKIGKFEGIFLRAQEIDNVEFGCSIGAFLQAVNEMHDQ